MEAGVGLVENNDRNARLALAIGASRNFPNAAQNRKPKDPVSRRMKAIEG